MKRWNAALSSSFVLNWAANRRASTRPSSSHRRTKSAVICDCVACRASRTCRPAATANPTVLSSPTAPTAVAIAVTCSAQFGTGSAAGATQLRKGIGHHPVRDAVVELRGGGLDGLTGAERILGPGAGHAVLTAEPARELGGRRARELGPLLEQVAELADDARHRRTVRHGQPTPRSRPSQYGLRSLNFWSLPVAVRASSERNSIDVGHL